MQEVSRAEEIAGELAAMQANAKEDASRVKHASDARKQQARESKAGAPAAAAEAAAEAAAQSKAKAAGVEHAAPDVPQ